MAFASAVLLSTLFCDYFPESKYKPLVWTGSLLLATTVGYLRFVSGVHFPTDILGGAVFGSAVGFLVPQLHQNSNSSEESNNLSYRIFPFQIMLLYNF
jgi:membrane-associated phospholipid phosphatase